MSIEFPYSQETLRADSTPLWLPKTDYTLLQKNPSGMPDYELFRTRAWTKDYFGACDQAGFIHGVMLYTKLINVSPDDDYNSLINWVTWYIGHGNTMCTNFYGWSELTIAANSGTFQTIQESGTNLSLTYDIHGFNHPEDREGMGIHYTAAHIPKVSLHPNHQSLIIEWEDMTPQPYYPIIGNPPTNITIS